MPVLKCAQRLRDNAGLNNQEAEEVLRTVSDRAQSISLREGLDRPEAIQKAAEQLKAEAEEGAKESERRRLIDLRTRVTRRQQIDDLTKQNNNDAYMGLRNFQVATSKGTKATMEALLKNRKASIIREFGNDMNTAGLYREFFDPKNEDAMYEEIAQLNDPENGQPGKSGNPAAKKLAEIVNKYYKRGQNILNDRGANIQDYNGYAGARETDPRKVFSAFLPDSFRDRWRMSPKAKFEMARDGFVKEALLRLDDRTFEGTPDKEAYLRKSFGEMASGNHITDGNGVGDPAFNGPGNLAESMSKARSWHFKSPQDELEWLRKVGKGDSVAETILNSITHTEGLATIMEHYGTNPTAEWKADIKSVMDSVTENDPAMAAKIAAKQPELMGHFAALMGTFDKPGNEILKNVGSYSRLMATVSKLGFVQTTHLMGTLAPKIVHHGLLDGVVGTFRPLFRFAASDGFKEFASLVSAGMDSHHGGMFADLQQDGVSGWANKMSNLYVKMTGLDYILKGEKLDTAAMCARQLGQHVDKEFGALPAKIRTDLGRYGITADDWEHIRNASGHFQFSDGGVGIIPRAAQNADSGAIENMLRTMGSGETPTDMAGLAKWSKGITENASAEAAASRVGDYKNNLFTKIDTYLMDSADRDVVTPGIAENWDLLRGTQSGTYLGEAARFLAQFKKWPLAATRQLLGEQIYGNKPLSGKLAGLATLITAGTFAGYGRMALHSLLNNEQPPEPSAPVVLAAMGQGGGMGIIGDFMLAKENRFGGGLSDTLAGPVIGQNLGDAYKLYMAARGWASDDPDVSAQATADIPAQAIHMARNNIPFGNLFYLKKVLDYAIFDNMMEAASPGYRGRMQAREAAAGTHHLIDGF